MTFSELNVSVTDLRDSLASFVGPSALSEISLRPPDDGGGEVSFLRLVAWSYVLIFEAGRVSIPFLLRSSGTYDKQRESLELIRDLRTWCFHNLGFASDRDRDLSRRVHRWFHDVCRQSTPDVDASWNRCFEKLCALVSEVVGECRQAANVVLFSPDDGQALIEDLRHRIERYWPPHRFDELVGDAAYRLGVSINVVKFRGPRVDAWRLLLLNIPEEDDPIEVVERRIEGDLLEYERSLLPISGNDVMERFGLLPGPEVGDTLRLARELFAEGTRDKADLLARLEDRLNEQRRQ